jgi:hypothetical protein
LDAEPFDLMLRGLHKGETFFNEKKELLGADRITRLQWRGMPEQWWSPSRLGARTRDEAVIAWLQVSSNAVHELRRIREIRSFLISLMSALVALAALGVSFASLIVACFKS